MCGTQLSAICSDETVSQIIFLLKLIIFLYDNLKHYGFFSVRFPTVLTLAVTQLLLE